MLGEDQRGDLDEALPDVIEVKAAGAGDLVTLLNEFTTEMRDQFELFRRLRAGAESLLDGADEALAKQARADIKAATDAIALIVRTLEKIDALLRQMERDRLDAEERLTEARDPEVLRDEVQALIAARVEAEVAGRLEAAVAARLAEVAGLAEGRGPP
jgi:phage shock protein A